jgi:hypothetical protein
MINFEARKIVEALRSGVSSRGTGQYFSSARQEFLSQISGKLDEICENKTSAGMIVTGKYGEGKTHLLNTVFNLAHSNNMVVSMISLSKETPFDKLYLIYQKLLQNTYLPKRLQPGFMDTLWDITPNSPMAAEMLAYTSKHLSTDKLFYLLRSFLNTDDMDEKYIILADLEGDFINNPKLKQIYKRIFSEKAIFNTNFVKTKHMDDYFATIAHFFLQMGYNGWVILFDETELVGRLGKKARLKAYKNMADFLFPAEKLRAVYSLFTLTTSYLEDVIEAKHEFENLREGMLDAREADAVEKTLKCMVSAKQLQPLTTEEILLVMEKLKEFYKRAYDWDVNLDMREILKNTTNRGYLLRTRIRAAVECLDQLYQYNKAADITINELGQAGYEEDIPSLEDMVEEK